MFNRADKHHWPVPATVRSHAAGTECGGCERRNSSVLSFAESLKNSLPYGPNSAGSQSYSSACRSAGTDPASSASSSRWVMLGRVAATTHDFTMRVLFRLSESSLAFPRSSGLPLPPSDCAHSAKSLQLSSSVHEKRPGGASKNGVDTASSSPVPVLETGSSLEAL